jgi:hypothetical protein
MGNLFPVFKIGKLIILIGKHKLEALLSTKLLSYYINSPRDYITDEIILFSTKLSQKQRITKESIDKLYNEIEKEMENV